MHMAAGIVKFSFAQLNCTMHGAAVNAGQDCWPGYLGAIEAAFVQTLKEDDNVHLSLFKLKSASRGCFDSATRPKPMHVSVLQQCVAAVCCSSVYVYTCVLPRKRGLACRPWTNVPKCTVHVGYSDRSKSLLQAWPQGYGPRA